MAYSATISCAECEKKFEAKSTRAKYCSPACRKAANRRPSKKGAAEEAGKQEPPQVTIPTPGGLVAAVAADLQKLQALDTVAGRAALALAYRIESPQETGSAAASMSKELTRLMEIAKSEVAPMRKDTVDALEEAVAAKLRLVAG